MEYYFHLEYLFESKLEYYRQKLYTFANMITDIDNAAKIAEYLLQIKAVKLQPNDPFTWSSGWKSPIYCDNRKTLSTLKYVHLFAKVLPKLFWKSMESLILSLELQQEVSQWEH